MGIGVTMMMCKADPASNVVKAAEQISGSIEGVEGIDRQHMSNP
jgi:hypothetical protein